MRGFCGCIPNQSGNVPPLSAASLTRSSRALPSATLPMTAEEKKAAKEAQKAQEKLEKFYMTQYKCAACGTTISGQISFAEHCKGRAHIKVAGFSGFAGLLPNDAGLIPPLPPQIASQIGATAGPPVSADSADAPDYAAIAAELAAKLKEEQAKLPPPPKPAHKVAMDQASPTLALRRGSVTLRSARAARLAAAPPRNPAARRCSARRTAAGHTRTRGRGPCRRSRAAWDRSQPTGRSYRSPRTVGRFCRQCRQSGRFFRATRAVASRPGDERPDEDTRALAARASPFHLLGRA